MAYNANRFYPHEAQISNRFKPLSVSNKEIIASHGYSFDKFREAIDINPFINRANSVRTGISFSLYGRLAIDLFTCENCYY